MIKSIVKGITGYAAKFVYAVIADLHTATINDIKECGVSLFIAYEAVAQLEVKGFIVRVGLGVYRIVDSCPQETVSCPPESADSVNVNVNVGKQTNKSPFAISSTSEIDEKLKEYQVPPPTSNHGRGKASTMPMSTLSLYLPFPLP